MCKYLARYNDKDLSVDIAEIVARIRVIYYDWGKGDKARSVYYEDGDVDDDVVISMPEFSKYCNDSDYSKILKILYKKLLKLIKRQDEYIKLVRLSKEILKDER